jgi:hypothetical protein
MNMYSNFSMMRDGNKYFGALHLSQLSIGFLLQIFGGSAALDQATESRNICRKNA